MAKTSLSKHNAAVEAATQQIGRELWEHLERRRPTVFERRWWLDHVLEWAMADESVKVQMFRFVDVLPMLRTHEAISQHLQEYFEEVRENLPSAARLVVEMSQWNSLTSKAVAYNARVNARKMAERFIAGSRVEEVLQSVGRLRKQGLAFTLDLLGEAVVSEPEADAYQQAYLELITGLAPLVNQWREDTQIDRDDAGWIPRCNVSLKLSALYSRFRPIDPAGSAEGVKGRLRPILRAARENDAYVHVDMEHYAYKDLTLEIFQQVLMEDEFRDYPDCGIVIQAYLPEAQHDLKNLLAWVKKRGTPIWVRLVKGAYWDYETVVSEYRGWPCPVYTDKWRSDANFEQQTRFLMENHQWLRPAIASHNLRSLSHAVAWAQELNVPQNAWEIQMLYGMGEELAHLLSEQGHRVRVYTPFGELIPGMAYLVRRLLENTSNDSFLRHTYDKDVNIESLLADPAATDAAQSKPQTPPKSKSAPPATDTAATPDTEDPEVEAFQNEPHADFSRPEVREAMQHALDDVADQLGGEYPLVINGKSISTRGGIASINPSHRKQVVGTASSATATHAEQAIEAARRAFTSWRNVSVAHRAEFVELMAAEMRNRRYELAAWEVYECAKPWEDADADVAEAIDFCMYYAAQMRALGRPLECDVAGEENNYFYRPRGVAAVIAAWNFPLAILTGMTAAALVAGNTVIMKPAEQSAIIAAKLMEIARDAGLPDGVLNYLPGVGEVVGPVLVQSPDVDVIAFTGSRPVGLLINKQAADTDPRQHGVKRVIAEMGGKNAIIVDADADLDEAVQGVLHSAFGYAGQKCSACSRVIVLQDCYDQFVQRLQAATESLTIGPAEDAGTFVPAVIDEEAQARVEDYIAIGRDECTTLVSRDVSKLKKEGFYVAPHVFGDVDPQSRLAQQEIFGPVLSVIRANSLDEAITIANGTEYALTGGMYSRSPKNLDRARQEMQVGNLYLNRSITGALVQRHPFGGYKMSGIGSKAGGRDYLLQFLIPVNITENTLRRGFAPPPEEEPA